MSSPGTGSQVVELSARVAMRITSPSATSIPSGRHALTPDANYNYTVRNVLENQNIEVYVQNAADVKEKRSIWVGTPGTLETNGTMRKE